MTRQTMRAPRLTYTDRLLQADTWQEVMALDEDDNYIHPCPVGEDIDGLADGPAPEFSERDAEAYESLCDIVEHLLSKVEREVFLGIVEQGKSLRLLADELDTSHESIRRAFTRAKLKLREAIEEGGY